MRKLVVFACVIGALAASSVAMADSTVLSEYASQGAKAVIKVKSATSTTAPTKATTPAVTSSGTLPFTGSDLTLVVVGGVLLVGLGVGLRRLKPDNN